MLAEAAQMAQMSPTSRSCVMGDSRGQHHLGILDRLDDGRAHRGRDARPYRYVALRHSGQPDGQYVYAVNEISDNISVYAVNATSGALTAIPGSPVAAGSQPDFIAIL